MSYLSDIEGTDIGHKNRGGWTALHEAAHHGRMEVVRYLVEREPVGMRANREIVIFPTP